jgi:hypothetical protein
MIEPMYALAGGWWEGVMLADGADRWLLYRMKGIGGETVEVLHRFPSLDAFNDFRRRTRGYELVPSFYEDAGPGGGLTVWRHRDVSGFD